MKKICMVAYTNYLSDARPRREAESLAQRGDQVDFISLAEQDHPQDETVDSVQLRRVKMIRYRGGSSVAYLLSYFWFFCSASFRLFKLYWRERYDIVYVHTMPDLMVLVGLLPKLMGARIVLNIHDMMPELYMSKFGIEKNHPLIRLLAFQEQLSIWFSDQVICVHEPHRQVLCGRGAPAGKIFVIPNAPDPRLLTEPQHASNETAFRIVYHGTIAKRLGLDLSVLAFEQIAAQCPDARLEIYGDGDAADDLDQHIQSSAFRERIYFSKKLLPVNVVIKKVQGASLGIVPNLRDAATDYMLPVKLLEYVHLGIPVIAPRLLAIQHYFHENMLEYYEAGNVDELAQAILRMYSNPARRAEFASKCSEFAKTFRWEEFRNVLFRIVDNQTDN